jgi:hypothetical protein
MDKIVGCTYEKICVRRKYIQYFPFILVAMTLPFSSLDTIAPDFDQVSRYFDFPETSPCFSQSGGLLSYQAQPCRPAVVGCVGED